MDHEVAPPVGRKINFGWIGESFGLFKRDALVWIAVTFISIAVGIAIQVACGVPTGFEYIYLLLTRHSLADIPHPGLVRQWLCQALEFVSDAYFYTGLYAMGNKSVRGVQLSIADLFSNGSKTISFFVYSIVATIAIFAGSLACCVGTFWTYMLVLPGFAVLADDGNISAALSKSVDGMKVDWFNAGLLNLELALILLVSIIPLGLGILVVGPMGYIIASLAYRDMIGMPNYNDRGFPEEHPADDSAWPPPPSGA
jgi:hypothetical protein